MNHSAERLAKKIGPFTRYGISGARISINQVDLIEPRFSSRVFELFNEMGTNHVFARDRIVRGLYEGMLGRNKVRLVMQESLLYHSAYLVESIMGTVGPAPSIECCVNVAQRIRVLHPELQVDVFENDLAALNRYYHPFMAAMFVLGERGGEECVGEIAAFIAWAGQQDDLDGALALAWRTSTIDVVSLQDMVDLLDSTHGSLNSGVI